MKARLFLDEQGIAVHCVGKKIHAWRHPDRYDGEAYEYTLSVCDGRY